MDLASIIKRLSEQSAELRFVGGSADIPSQSAPAKRPSAFVYPLIEQPAANTLVSGVDQRVQVRFAVLLCVTDARPGIHQGRTLTELEAVRESVRIALLNWQPPNASDICEFAGGQLQAMGDGLLWWQDDYQTAEHWRKTD